MLHCKTCNKEIETLTKLGPFCSARCKAVDLGAWASEEYRIPVTYPTLLEDEGEPDYQQIFDLERDGDDGGRQN